MRLVWGSRFRLALVVLALALALGSLSTVSYLGRAFTSKYTALPRRPPRVAIADLEPNRPARARRGLADLTRWEQAAERLGLEAETLLTSDLGELHVDRYAALVLPEQERLAEAAWSRIEGFLAAGGGVVFTGRSGGQDAAGEARDPTLLQRAFPGRGFEELSPAPERLRVSGRGPLAAGLEPGERIEVDAGRLALGLRAPSSISWGTDAGVPEPGAILVGSERGGPAVWMGFAAAGIADEARAGALLQNALRYATRRPLADLGAWPDGAAAAALLAPEAAIRMLVETGPGPVEVAGPEGAVSPELTGESDPELLLGRLISEFSAVEREGGLYALAVPIPWLSGAESDRVVAGLLDELGARGVWIAGDDAVSSWWSRRGAVELELWRPRLGLARLTLRNSSDEPIERVTARVYLPLGARTPTQVSSAAFGARPALRVASDRSWIELIAPRIDAGEAVTYAFRY